MEDDIDLSLINVLRHSMLLRGLRIIVAANNQGLNTIVVLGGPTF